MQRVVIEELNLLQARQQVILDRIICFYRDYSPMLNNYPKNERSGITKTIRGLLAELLKYSTLVDSTGTKINTARIQALFRIISDLKTFLKLGVDPRIRHISVGGYDKLSGSLNLIVIEIKKLNQ